MSKDKEVKKSRHLSVHQLFEVLQEEYIVCELRYKIYPLVAHKEYWRCLMEKKKEKIIDISRRNSLFSIFDDKRIRLDFTNRIIPEIGFPNFIYKDDHQRLLQEKWDIHNYYLPQTKVKVYSDSNMIFGIINIIDLKERKAIIITDNGQSLTFDLALITRIL